MTNRRKFIALLGAAPSAPATATTTTTRQLRKRELGRKKKCPAEYNPSRHYKAGKTASIGDAVYRCKSGPDSAYCNAFPPDYVHESGGGVVHGIGEELGWIDCGPCARWLATDGECPPKDSSSRDAPKLRRGKWPRAKGTEARGPAARTKRAEKKRAKKRKKKRGGKGPRREPRHSALPSLRSYGYRSTDEDAIRVADDAYVDRRRGDGTYNLPVLQFDPRDKAALLRFALPEAAYQLVLSKDFEATLRVYSLQSCDGALKATVVSGDFDEGTVTWGTAPFAPGPDSAQPLETAPGLSRDAWYEIDVSNAALWSAEVVRQRYVTFRISSEGDGGGGECALASKEYGDGGLAPTLNINSAGSTAGGTAPPPAPPAAGTGNVAPPAGDFDPYVPTSAEEWYVDYSLGSQGGECVANCEEGGGDRCGGPATFWEELFAGPEECCEAKLWWMGRGECVPGLF